MSRTDKTTLERRAFVAGSIASIASLAAGCSQRGEKPHEGATPLPSADETRAEMPMRTLGKTGEKVSAIGIGGFHIGIPDDDSEGIAIIRTAIDRGITFLDNCWDYHRGKSEVRMGKALSDGYRDKVFLMTKIDGRTKKAAAEQLDQSLQRLGTDRIDLVQIHEVIRMTDPDRCFAEGGTIEALLDARKAGKLRYIGFTGHKDPSIHLAMLDAADRHGFTFDTVQMPLNVMDAHFKSFEKEVLPRLVAKGIGVLGMKPLGSGIILESKAVTAPECLRYALSLPTSVVITGCESLRVLEQAISVALSFQPLNAKEVDALLAKTRDAAQDGRFEKFKTSERFDGTTQHPQWLETSSV